jgi:hypothetical protein
LPADTPLHGVFAVDEGSASIAVAAAAVFSFTLRAFALQSATAADFTMKQCCPVKKQVNRAKAA